MSGGLEAGGQRPYARAAGATEVLLVRHGAYAHEGDGADRLRDGQADPPLADLGRAQAERVAERLLQRPFDRVFVSPLWRTQQTAAPLLARTGGSAVVIEELREIYLGDFDGYEFERRRAAGDPHVAAIAEQQRWDVVPGAERMDDFGARVRKGLEAVADQAGRDATAVAFVHAGVIAEVCAQITGSRRLAFIGNENTGITTVIREPGGAWLLRSFNDTTHVR